MRNSSTQTDSGAASPKVAHSAGLVVVDAITKWFASKVALNHVSFAVPGQICGLLGPNGVGKTTLLRYRRWQERPKTPYGIYSDDALDPAR